MRNTIAAAAAAAALALTVSASAFAAGELPQGWEVVTSDGEKVFHNTASGIAVSIKIIPAEGAPVADVAKEVAKQKDCKVEEHEGGAELTCSGGLSILLEQHDDKNLGMIAIACGSASEEVCHKDALALMNFLNASGK